MCVPATEIIMHHLISSVVSFTFLICSYFLNSNRAGLDATSWDFHLKRKGTFLFCISLVLLGGYLGRRGRKPSSLCGSKIIMLREQESGVQRTFTALKVPGSAHVCVCVCMCAFAIGWRVPV